MTNDEESVMTRVKRREERGCEECRGGGGGDGGGGGAAERSDITPN